MITLIDFPMSCIFRPEDTVFRLRRSGGRCLPGVAERIQSRQHCAQRSCSKARGVLRITREGKHSLSFSVKMAPKLKYLLYCARKTPEVCEIQAASSKDQILSDHSYHEHTLPAGGRVRQSEAHPSLNTVLLYCSQLAVNCSTQSDFPF